MSSTSFTEGTRELAARDPVVALLVDQYGPVRLQRRTPASGRFAALAEAIVYQQFAGAAATAIHGRLVAKLGGEVTPERVLASSIEELRSAGLSGAKARSLWDLSQKVGSGEVQLEKLGRVPDAEVIDHLVQVRGIGRWTAEMFLMFTLRRVDVWPVSDYGVRVGFAKAWKLDELPTPKELDERGEPFRPFRSVVAWYCWRAAEQKSAVTM